MNGFCCVCVERSPELNILPMQEVKQTEEEDSDN